MKTSNAKSQWHHNRKYGNALGFNETLGYCQWAAAICGHPSANPKADYCMECYHAKRRKSDFIEKRGKNQIYRAECGHEARRTGVKRCRACVQAQKKGDVYLMEPSKKGRRISTHRMIAEKALGRPLKSHEVVHHINMNKRDNRPENLLICTREYHRYLHHAYQLAFARTLVA